MTYTIIKRILESGNKKNVVTAEKLDVFLLANRLTADEYNELLGMLS